MFVLLVEAEVLASSSGVGMAQSMIPVFSGENYDMWNIKMRTLLLSQGLWDIVENGYKEYDVFHQSKRKLWQRTR